MGMCVRFIDGNVVQCTSSLCVSSYRIGSVCWATLFNEKAVQVLGFTGNAYMSMTSDAERYAALEMLRGARVMVSIRKRVAGQYVNYNVSELEVVTV